ncbi:hypothetical protein HKX48_006138 [Thoreauomyces humboldtii]|nr:hypothetical protein HKX48_006138 [Thoreauomyces humboldtii]
MGFQMNTQSMAITAAATFSALALLLVVGPPTTHKKKLTRKIAPPSEANSPIPAPQLSASWSFVDQSIPPATIATLFRSRDHAESLYNALADPETYYSATRQPEFGVEILDKESGLIRFIRYRRSRRSGGARVVVERRIGEEGRSYGGVGFESDSAGVWFVEDSFCVFNTTVTIRHTLRVAEEEAPATSTSRADALTPADAEVTLVADAAVPSTTLEIEIVTRGPVGTAFVLAHKYTERMESALNAVQAQWDGKDPEHNRM